MAEIVTGEAVPLDLPAAAYPSRVLARAIDMLVQQLVLYFIPIVAAASHNTSYATALLIASYIIVLVGYPTAFETISRGQTLGKLALGLRVIGDDGSPVRFRQALVRALAGLIEIWSIVLLPVALITSLANPRFKRLGDIFAGTYVICERVPVASVLRPVYAFVPPPLAGWAPSLQVDALSDRSAEAAASYLRRYAEFSPQTQVTLGHRLAAEVAAQVSPPPPAGTPPVAYLSAVLAVRRQKELAGYAAARPPLSWAAPRTEPTLFRSEGTPPPETPSPAPQSPPAPSRFAPPT